MLRDLLKFEVQFHVRNKLFWVAAFAFLYFGYAFSAYGLQIPYVYTNSPYLISYVLAMLSLGSVFVLTLFCANAVLRDKECNLREIIYSTPISKITYLGSRVSGALLCGFVVFSFAAIGILVNIFLSYTDPEKIGPFQISHFLWPLFILTLPNLLFSGALIFLVATCTQNRMSTYLAGLFIYILYVIGSIYTSAPWLANATPATPEAMALAARLDPFGISAFFEQTRYWSTVDQNNKLFALEGNFLFNRLLWTILSLILLCVTYLLYSFRIKVAPTKSKTELTEEAARNVKYKPVAVMPQASKLKWFAFRRMTSIEIGLILKSRAFLVVLVLWVFLVGTELWSLTEAGLRMSPDYPTTGKIITKILQVVHLFGVAVIIFYSSEQLWRNRQLKTDELIDVTPISDFILYSSKYVALAIIPLLLVTISILVGLMLQVSEAYYIFEPDLYLSLYYFACIPLLLIAAMVLFIETLAPNKYVGTLLTIVLVLGTGSGLSSLAGIKHVLLRFAAPLSTPLSDMNGFGGYANAFHWRMLYWGAASCLLSVFTYTLWERGENRKLIHRFRSLSQLPERSKKLLTACMFVLAICGSYIFYHTNVAHNYVTDDEQKQWSKGYEENYKHISKLPQPTIIAVSSSINLYTEQQRYQVKGKYTIRNKTGKPLTQVWIGIHQDSKLESITIAGASLIKGDNQYGMYQFSFDQPLQPNQETIVMFVFSHSWTGFSGHSSQNAIVHNGSFIRISRYFPFFGYEPDFELENPDTRRKVSLPEPVSPFLPLDAPTQKQLSNYIHFESTISTSAEQTVVTSGNLIKKWRTGGRNYFHYKSDRPMPFRFAVASAYYKVAKTNYKGVDIEVYHHPTHGKNVAAIVETIREAFAYCTEQFGAYPYQHFRLAEVSLFTGGFAATSYPNTIFALENRGFVSDLSDARQLHYLYQLISHEVAHQWWGGQLDPDYREGADMLTETLAQYTELMLLEKLRGKNKVQQALAIEQELYFSSRGQEPEKPLYKVENQPYVSYHKGAVVMYALKEKIGEKQINLALTKLLQKYSFPSPPPTSLDLLNELKKVSPGALHKQLDEWVKEVIVYDLKLEKGIAKRLPDGRFKVTLTVSGFKLRNVAGQEMKSDLADEVVIAIYGNEVDSKTGQPLLLYNRRHFIDKGISEVTIVLDKRPKEAEIDPHYNLLDNSRDNNWIKVSHL